MAFRGGVYFRVLTLPRAASLRRAAQAATVEDRGHALGDFDGIAAAESSCRERGPREP